MVETNRSTDPTLLERMSSEVAPEVSPLMRFLLDNARRIMIGLAVCVVAAAGYGVYNWHAGKQVTDAQNALGRLLVLPESADKLAKLKAFKTSAPKGVLPSVTLAVARSAMLAKDFTTAAAAWKELSADTKDPIHVTAMIGQAESLAAQNKDAEALAVIESATVAPDSAAVHLVNSLIADLAEKTGNMEKAAAACDKIATAVAGNSPEEADFWRQKAAALRARGKAAS